MWLDIDFIFVNLEALAVEECLECNPNVVDSLMSGRIFNRNNSEILVMSGFLLPFFVISMLFLKINYALF